MSVPIGNVPIGTPAGATAMGLIELLIVVVIVLVILGLIVRVLPIPEPYRGAIIAVVCLVALLWIVRAFL